MKYGDTLQQRSNPLWETYNVDYNDIKRLIKVRTTQGQGQAKAIGSLNEAKQLEEFEGELYGELREQHQRISLFVQSKAGEIARRLAHLDKQIAQLENRAFASGRTKLSVRRLEKFSRAESATLKAGEEIQFLSRFVEAQRLAFQKLLKKYKKWTHSADLEKRFREEILDQPTSFSRRNFQPLLAQWTEVLTRVRAPFENGTYGCHVSSSAKHRAPVLRPSDRMVSSHQEAGSSTADASDGAAALHSIWESGSNVELDTALAVLPLGPRATKAVYWVHPDNIVQLHVLLLQYTRLQRPIDSNVSSSVPVSSRSSSRAPLSTNRNRHGPCMNEGVGIIVCDDVQPLAKGQNDVAFSDFQGCPRTSEGTAAASIRYTCNGEAVVVVGSNPDKTPSPAKSRRGETLSKAKVDCKNIQKLFIASETHGTTFKSDSRDCQRVCDWFAKHQGVQPLVQLQARRARFVGLQNSRTSGVWATLDKDILMQPSSRDSISSGNFFDMISPSGEADSRPFPYAILEVRVEGDADSDLITQLDASDLTERILRFSLEIHAMATLCKPYGMSQPSWLPALERDIRKMPAATERARGRAPQGRLSSEQSSSRHTSITTNGASGSGFSAVQDESSATSAPNVAEPRPFRASKKSRRQPYRKRSPEKGLREQSRDKQRRYWNEFDDGSEGSAEEAYTIFVYPHAAHQFPGAAVVTKFCTPIVTTINMAQQKVASWLRLSQESNSQREHLINHDRPPNLEDSDLSEEDRTSRNVNVKAQRRYSTFPNLPQSSTIRVREKLLIRSCLMSFGAAFILLLVAAILKTTGRRKAETAVDAGVIIGVAASLVFAVIAVASMVGRKDNVGWVHRSFVILIFACVVVCGGALLASLA